MTRNHRSSTLPLRGTLVGGATIDWKLAIQNCKAYARRRVGAADADDVASEAIVRLLVKETESPDAELICTADLEMSLGSIVNGLVANLRRKQQRRLASRYERQAVSEHHTDAIGSTGIELEQTIGGLRRRANPQTISSALLDLMLAGVNSPREQATALDVQPKAIYNARRRLSWRARQHTSESSTKSSESSTRS